MTLRGRLWGISGLPAWPSVALPWAMQMPTMAGMDVGYAVAYLLAIGFAIAVICWLLFSKDD
jgi:hypothetical protein